MGREEKSSISFAVIKKDGKGRPYFSLDGKMYQELSGVLSNIYTEDRKIVPKEGSNKGVEVEVRNLILDLSDEEGRFKLSVPLYSDVGRTILNSLAGKDPLGLIYLNVYLNKNGFTKISLKKYKTDNKDDKEQWYSQLHTYEEFQFMLTKTKVKGKEKDDYDKLSDDFVAEMMPIIQQKLSKTSNNDLPF